MKQTTLANNDFEQFRKPTRREKFLAEMNTVVPWAELVAVIEPYYPKTSKAGGRPPVGLERMLRMHCLQLWFDLSDPAVEEERYDSVGCVNEGAGYPKLSSAWLRTKVPR